MTTPPTQASLDALFSRATRVRVLEGGASDGRPLGAVVLVEARGADVRAVREHLRIQENGPDFHCMCLGDLAVELLVQDERLTTLGFHHCSSLRHPGWSSDAMLVDGPALARWLASRGAPGPLRAHEEDLERSRLAGAARRAWLAAAPPCFAQDLPRFEADAHGMPLGPGSPEYDVAEERVRASYATPEIAAAALLAWFGAGAGPWSGYPSYEGLAEALLLRLGLPIARAAASSPNADGKVLRGAARLFSAFQVVSHEKSEVGDVPEASWATLRPIVQAMQHADNLARFEHAAAVAAEVRRLRARPAPVAAGAGLRVAGVSRNGPLSGLVTDGHLLYAGEGADIVIFDVASSTAPKVLFQGTDPFFEIAPPVSKMLFVAHVNAGTIGKVLTDGGGLIVMARDQARPVDPFAGHGAVAWLNQAMVPDPKRGAPFVVQRSSVMSFDSPTPKVLREAPGSAFSLTGDEEHLYWCEITAQMLEIWRAPHRRAGAAGRLAVLGERSLPATWFPELAVNATHLLWANPERRAILGVDKRAGGAPVVIAQTNHPPAHIVADDHDVIALTGASDAHDWHVEHAPARGGGSTVVARYRRQLWDRPALVLTPRDLYFTTSDRVLRLARA